MAAHRLGFDRADADYGDPAADQALAADVAAGHVAPANRMRDYLAWAHDDGARARFQAAVAAVGEPARPACDSDTGAPSMSLAAALGR